MKNIILYTTGCPCCTVLKNKLNEKSIRYTEVTSVDEIKAKGITRVPVLEIDGNMFEFKDAVNWVNKQ